jgi:hypothetical protein
VWNERNETMLDKFAGNRRRPMRVRARVGLGVGTGDVNGFVFVHCVFR